jgi:exopolysaccharide biosynthesis polyprenyl glycosylphosphotransferase
MFRDRETYYSPLLFFLDCLATCVSYVASLFIYLGFIAELPEKLPNLQYISSPYFHWDNTLSLLPLVVIPFLFFFQFSMKVSSLKKNGIKNSLFPLIIPCLFASIVFLCILLIKPELSADIWFVVVFVVLLWLLLLANRVLMQSLIKRLSRKKNSLRYVLIVGTDSSALKIAQLFTSHHEWGIKIVGLLTGNSEEVRTKIGGFNVLGDMDDLFPILEKRVVDCVVFAEEASNGEEIRNLALRCPVVGVDFILNVSSFVKKASYVGLESTGDHSFIVFKPVWRRPEMLFLKRLIDLVASAIAIVLCLPLWIIIPVLIKRDSPGPVFYVQERVGKNGRLFPMYKFRSMVDGADKMQSRVMHLNEMDGPVFKIKADPRLTRIGKFLRRTSLDELPQLFNVFKGNMSLVGPRPPILSEVSQYRPWQRKRLSVTPGVTCLWQVTGRSEVKFDEWMKLDMQYIENWSLALDAKILLRTIKAVIKRRGAV